MAVENNVHNMFVAGRAILSLGCDLPLAGCDLPPAMAARPLLNVCDIPEVSGKFKFEGRCSKALHNTELEELACQGRELRSAAGGTAAVAQLAEMFKDVDASLVRSLAADAPSPQYALETLMALSVAAAGPAASRDGPFADVPAQEVGTDDWELVQPPSDRGTELGACDDSVTASQDGPRVVQAGRVAARGAVQSTRKEQVRNTRDHRTPAGKAAAVAELEAMFPTLDASLVRSLAADAPTLDNALDTLMALSATTATPTAPIELPPLDKGQVVGGPDDMIKFPSLATADGWELPGRRGCEFDDNGEESTAWRDRARSAAALPDPVCVHPRKAECASATIRGAGKERRHAAACREAEVLSDSDGPNPFEVRQQHAQWRARNIGRQQRAQRRPRNVAQQMRGRRTKCQEMAGEGVDGKALGLELAEPM